MNRMEKELPGKYPGLFHEQMKRYGISCRDGWFDLLDTLCHLLSRHEPKPVVMQVKEKFGGLRFYYDGGDEFVAGAVAMAENMSYRICDVCGAPGELRENDWMRTLCDKHHEEREAAKTAKAT